MIENYLFFIEYLLRRTITVIGDVLKKTRLIYGYKAKDMCKLLDISQSYLSEIENNKKEPSLSLLKKYAEIYDMKLSSLLIISESYDDSIHQKKSDQFISKLMIKLINGMYNEK